MKFSIIIPTLNRWDLLSKCLKSIRDNTDLTDAEVIIVSNGCTDYTKALFDIEYKNKHFHLIEWSKALGYPKAVNMGMSAATGDYVILLNNDTELFSKDWVDQLLQPFYNNPKAGVTGLIKRYQGGKPWVLFFCAAIKRDVINKIGLLDETFTPGCGEDIDFCIRAYNAGYEIIQVPEVKLENITGTNQMAGPFPINHVGGATVSRNPTQEITYARNMKIIEERYGIPTSGAAAP
jgi:GT2 family glycosyltransferase